MPRPWRSVFWCGLVCWLLGLWWQLSRVDLWLLDIVVVPAMTAMYWFGLLAVVAAVIGRHRRTLALTLVPVMLVVSVLFNAEWRTAPRTWFTLHRPLFERALVTDPGPDYYGTELPRELRFLSVTGKVSWARKGVKFFPQWAGIPDDAGGYLYSPGQSPEGADLYGWICAKPVDLGGEWWMCGLRNNGW